MTSAQKILKQLITAAGQPGDELPPADLLSHLGSLSEPLAAVGDFDACNRLFGVFWSTLPQLHEPGEGPKLSDEFQSRWIATLRWVIRELRQWTPEGDEKHRKLIACLTIVRGCRRGASAWELFPEDIGRNLKLMEAMEAAVRSSKCSFSARGARKPPVWEQEAVDELIAADKKEDWLAIYELWPHFEATIFSNTFLDLAVSGLARFGFNRLLEATADIHETAAAMILAQALPTEQRLRVAAASKSEHIRFCFVLASVFRLPKTTRLDETSATILSDLLVGVASDADRWSKWMRAFNRYPVRHPALQVPLGRAVARIGNIQQRAYIDAIELGTYPSECRDLVTECLTAFRDAAPPDVRRNLWEIGHQRWKAWHFGAEDEESLATGIVRSYIDYAVIGYVLECLTEDQRLAERNSIFERLSNIEHEWHASKIAMLSAWYRGLSELQPYLLAEHLTRGDKAWLSNKYQYYPVDTQHRNYRLMFEMRELNEKGSTP
jgi:hypothetical protein